MMDNFISEALSVLFSQSGLLSVLIGVMVGLVVGILPGLGQGVALLLTLPVVLSYPPTISLIIYASLLGATTFGGSITSVILGVPGSVQNLTTLIDGYPMSRRGRAGRAIGLSAFSSMLGALMGIIVVIAAIPFVQILIYVYGSREYFLTVVLAAVVVSIVNPDFFKGLVSFCVGCTVSLIGCDLVFAVNRYTGGIFYLRGKIPIAVFIIGLFALTSLVMLQSKGETIAKGGVLHAKFNDTLRSFIEVIKNWPVVIRSSVVGLIIGIIPGVGGEVAQFISYGLQKGIDKNKPSYGNGEPRGVIASEASNSAKDSGALLPTICLGIPGAPEMAILLGILLIIGINPGPGMLVDHGNLLWLIILASVAGNMLSCIICVLGSPWLSRITTIPIHYVFAAALPLAFTATYSWNSNVWDCVVLGFFCLIGIALTRCKYPIAPLILGFVLGPLAENSFHTTLQSGYYNPAVFFQSKTAVVLIVVIVLLLVMPLIRVFKKGRKPEYADKISMKDADGEEQASPLENIILIAIILAVAVVFMILAPGYDLSRSGLFPFVISLAMAVSAAVVLISDIKKLRSHNKHSSHGRAEEGWRQYLPALAFLFSYIILLVFIGMYAATLLAFSSYFRFFGGKTVLRSVISGAVITLAIFVLFHLIFSIELWPGALPLIIPGYLGGGNLRPFF
jgi:putative tricarboxylic transport membrane protein